MTKNEIVHLSEMIKLQRFKEKKSQEECANGLNISIPTYREYENNPNKLSLEQAIILGKILNFNIFDIFFESYIA